MKQKPLTGINSFLWYFNIELHESPKRSGTFYKRRRERHVKMLLERFEEKEGAQVEQDAVMKVLQLNNYQKIQATNAVKLAFPHSTIIRKGTGPDPIQLYKNICVKLLSAPISTSNVPSLELNESPEISNIKALISNATSELDLARKNVDDHLSEEDVNQDVVKALLHKQRKAQSKLQELNDLLINLFQKAINELRLNQSQCEELCSFEVHQLQKEINVFSAFLNTELGSKTLTDCGLAGCFSKLTSDVKEKCPLLFNVLCNIFLHKKDG